MYKDDASTRLSKTNLRREGGSCDVGTSKYAKEIQDGEEDDETLDVNIERRKREEQKKKVEIDPEEFDLDSDEKYEVQFNCKDICVAGDMDCNEHKSIFISG